MPDNFVDLVLTDLPYGSTACTWDTIIPFDALWEQWNRVVKKDGAIVLTASQPFTSLVVNSNIKAYKHHWIWQKERGTGFQVAKYRPMMKTEDVIVFCRGKLTYNPQMTKRDKPLKYRYPKVQSRSNPLASYSDKVVISTEKYPENILSFKTERGLHPTQKPVAFFEYLIKTYSNEGDVVMDNCMGSGTTAVASQNLNRNYIGSEISKEYCDIAEQRLRQAVLL
jgi:site-specific DNA-methyltransferase (adenine-specific)